MTDLTQYIPGSDMPARTTKAAQLKIIAGRARGSQAIVDLLCELAFGHATEEWPEQGPIPFAAASHAAAFHVAIQAAAHA